MAADKKLVKERYQLEKKLTELQAAVHSAEDEFRALKREVLDFSSLPYQDVVILKRKYIEAWSVVQKLARKMRQQEKKLKSFAENYPAVMKEKISTEYLLEKRRGA